MEAFKIVKPRGIGGKTDQKHYSDFRRFTMHGFELFPAFFGSPKHEEKGESGILWEKMIENALPLLKLIEMAIEKSDWYAKWPDPPPLRDVQEKALKPDLSLKAQMARAEQAV